MSENKISTQVVKKSIATPSHGYDSVRDIWAKSRAVIRGQESVKAHDELVNDYDSKGNLSNILLPFSPSMTQAQYDFFKGEAELPGITSQYARSMIGALLRKETAIVFSNDKFSDQEKVEYDEWLRSQFTSDNKSLFHFLDNALWEEMQTSYPWIYVDVPNVSEEEYDSMSDEQKALIKPYPTLITAEKVINVIRGSHPVTKVPTTLRFITRELKEVFEDDNPWHPKIVDTVRDHYLDNEGFLVVDQWELDNSGSIISVENGTLRNGDLAPGQEGKDHTEFKKKYTFYPKKFGKRLDRIPAWPLNGETEIGAPILLTFVNREIGLYNKVSRRNHLMYGAATYTPVIIGNLQDEEKEDILNAGLGTLWFLDSGSQVDTLAPPTEALNDMQVAIDATMSEIARMGIRMLAPETNSESGVALELRNSSQTASLGTLNMKVSQTIRQVFAFMINWRYDKDITAEDIEFTMSSDFSPQAQGEMGMRLVGEWYQAGLVPRSVFLDMAKKNDYLPSEYSDIEGMEEIEKDPIQQAAADVNKVKIEE